MDVDERGSWFHVLSEGVVLVEAGLVTDLNGAAAELLDVDRSAARGRSLISVLRDHRLERLAAGSVGVDAGENGATLELELRGRLVTAYALPGALLLRDITEATAARSEARELLAVLSHELRTPVAAIRGVLEALSSGLGAERLATERLETARLAYFVERATGEAERLSRLLTDLTVDVKPPRERTVDLFATAARAVAVTESVQRRHGVSVTLLPTSARAWVDEDKLLQALVNLLENAVIHGVDPCCEAGTITCGPWAIMNAQAPQPRIQKPKAFRHPSTQPRPGGQNSRGSTNLCRQCPGRYYSSRCAADCSSKQIPCAFTRPCRSCTSRAAFQVPPQTPGYFGNFLPKCWTGCGTVLQRRRETGPSIPSW